MKKTLLTPPYEKPYSVVIKIDNSGVLLWSGEGQGSLPPTENNNEDNDWVKMWRAL